MAGRGAFFAIVRRLWTTSTDVLSCAKSVSKWCWRTPGPWVGEVDGMHLVCISRDVGEVETECLAQSAKLDPTLVLTSGMTPVLSCLM